MDGKIALMERMKSNGNSWRIVEKSMEKESNIYGRIPNDGTYKN